MKKPDLQEYSRPLPKKVKGKYVGGDAGTLIRTMSKREEKLHGTLNFVRELNDSILSEMSAVASTIRETNAVMDHLELGVTGRTYKPSSRQERPISAASRSSRKVIEMAKSANKSREKKSRPASAGVIRSERSVIRPSSATADREVRETKSRPKSAGPGGRSISQRSGPVALPARPLRPASAMSGMRGKRENVDNVAAFSGARIEMRPSSGGSGKSRVRPKSAMLSRRP